MTFVHEVETAFQKGQLGIETDYGIAVPATIALGSVTLTPAMKRTVNKFTPRGRLLPTVQTTGREYTEIGFEGQATYEELGYFVKSVVSDDQIDPLTHEMVYTVEAGGLKIPGSIVSAWTLKGTRDEVTISGSMLGKKWTVAEPTVDIAIPDQTPVTAASAVITIDGTRLDKVFDWEIALSDIWGGATFIGSSTFANILQKAITATMKVKVESDAAGLALLEVGDQVPVSIGCSDGARSVAISAVAKVGEPGTFSDEEGVYAIEHNLNLMNDDTEAISVEIV